MSEQGELDFARFEVLTFDCYGTLIDWEAGIAAGLRNALGAAAAGMSEDELLEAFAVHEAAAEAGEWIAYREVLVHALRGVADLCGYQPTDEAAAAFAASVGAWPPFPDAADGLRRLAARFELGVITNCDDDLFAASHSILGAPFRWVVTAQQARSYKPARRNFELALERINRPPERILHVAQSLYHDHVPAKQMGLATAWIDRRRDRPGFGATPAATAQPDLATPDLASFARLALAAR